MTTQQETILSYWMGYFPEGLFPSDETIDRWIASHSIPSILAAISVAVRKHRENAAAGKPMTLKVMCHYAEGVMARMTEYQTMPLPVCPGCGEVLDENGACAKAVCQ